MNHTFKVGDRVRRINGKWAGMKVGDEGVVTGFHLQDSVFLDDDHDGSHMARNLTLVKDGSPSATQIGGDHYKDMPTGYQPYQIALVLKLDAVDFNMLKYLLRYAKKGGKEDLEKLIHTAQFAIAEKYPEASQVGG